MENLILSFTSIFPLVSYLLVGYLVRRSNIVDERARKQVNNLIFRLFLPLSLFMNVYNSSFDGDQNLGPVVLYAVGTVLLVYAVSWFYYSRVMKERKEVAVMVQNAFRSNYILFGMSLSSALMAGGGQGITGILVTVQVPLFNILAVIVLQYYSDGKASWAKLAKGIVTNPFVVAAALAFLLKLLPGRMPDFLQKPLNGMAGISTPLAMIILGAEFNFRRSGLYAKQIVSGVVTRLVLVPALALGGAILLGFRGETLIAYLSLFASPVAVSSYSMAQQMGSADELAGQLLVYSTGFCGLTLFLWIFFLKQMALI